MEARPNESTTSQASEPSVGQKRERPQDEQSPDLDVAKRRLQIISGTPARVEASPAYAQSADFWYPDGNIVIIVENTGFKLLLSRIKQYCKLFQNEIPAEGDGTSDACSLPQIVSYTLTGVKVADFTEFLRAMETPLIFVLSPPPQNVALSLLRVASRVECETVLEVAIHRLRKLWPSTPPTTAQAKAIDSTLIAINAARQFKVPGILKRAFYELLRNPVFWLKVVTQRQTLSLSDADLLALYHARDFTQQHWRELVFLLPGKGGECLSTGRLAKKCAFTDGAERAAYWRSQFVEDNHLEKGAGDPIWYIGDLLQGPMFNSQTGTWCRACLDERQVAWNAMKSWLWFRLDHLLPK